MLTQQRLLVVAVALVRLVVQGRLENLRRGDDAPPCHPCDVDLFVENSVQGPALDNVYIYYSMRRQTVDESTFSGLN